MGTVSGHQLSTFSSPVNGTSPIDANTVRGNDNTIKTSYNAHDADVTIHLQSGAVASRPSASTANQTWLATDTGAVYLYLDTGSAWVEVNYLRNTGGTVSGNVTITGTLESDGNFSVNTSKFTVAASTGNTVVAGTLNVTGQITGNVTGNASTATALANARTLWGQSFDGTANISGALSSVSTISMSGTLTMTAAASKIVPGATSFSHRNNADSADNLLITDAGAVTVRAGLTVSSGTTALQALTATSGAFTGLVSTTASNGKVFGATSGTTNGMYAEVQNTGCDAAFGAASSVAGNPYSGALAYAAFIGNFANNPLDFVTNGIRRGGFSAAGELDLTGALKLGVSYTAGAPAATGYVTLKDSTGTTYKVLVST